MNTEAQNIKVQGTRSMRAKTLINILNASDPAPNRLLDQLRDVVATLDNKTVSVEEIKEIDVLLDLADGVAALAEKRPSGKLPFWTREKEDSVDANFVKFNKEERAKVVRYAEIRKRAEHLKQEIDSLRSEHSVNQIAEKADVPVSTLYSFLESVNKGDTPKLNKQAEAKLTKAFTNFTAFDEETYKADIENKANALFEERIAPVKEKLETLTEELTRNIPIVSIMQPNGEMQSPSMRFRYLQFELPAYFSKPPNSEHSDFSRYNGALIKFVKSDKTINVNEELDPVWQFALVEEEPLDILWSAEGDDCLVLAEGTEGEQTFGYLCANRDKESGETEARISMVPEGDTDMEVAAAWKVVHIFPANQGRIFIPKGRVNPTLTS